MAITDDARQSDRLWADARGRACMQIRVPGLPRDIHLGIHDP